MQKLMALGFVVMLIIVSCTKKKTPAPPNFVLIMADDLGWDDLGIHGNTYIETPTLDSLAQNSVQFDHFYVNPCCAPTRASLLTGRNFLNTGVSHVHGGKDFLNLNETTIADILQKNGYATGMWGKWHSGHAPGYQPWERGFDEAYKAQLYKHREGEGELNGVHVESDKWGDEIMVDYAIEFIEKNKQQPFFAYLPSMTPHGPLDAPEELIEKYMQKGLSRPLGTLYAMVDLLDSQVNRLLRYLEDNNLSENTIVFFLSDNGPAINNMELSDQDREIRYVNGYNGHKGNIWENGIKSPLFVYGKNKYNSSKIVHVTDVTDILPTILDIAGIAWQNDSLPIEGLSFKKYLEGDTSNRKGKVSFNYANPGWPPTDKPWTAVGVHDEYRPVTEQMKDTMQSEHQIITICKNNYKLLLNPAPYTGTPKQNDGYVLIDIMNDPFEKTNLVDQQPEIANAMKAELLQWFDHVKSNPSSFKMPVFTLDFTKSDTFKILAKAPVDISNNIQATFSWLQNWSKVGDYADYQIHAIENGNYELFLDYQTTEITNSVFEVSIDTIFAVTLVATGKESSSREQINIPEGNHLLKVKLTDLAGSQKAFDKLQNIMLIHYEN